MSATTTPDRLAQRIGVYAARAIAGADQARERLTEGLAHLGAHLDTLMEAVLVAEGNAKPWRQLTKRIERHGARSALARQREEALEILLQYGGPGTSTSLVTNAARHAEHDGLRRFLGATNGMDIDEDPTPIEASPSEPEPAPAPAPVEIPKATPAQRRTLDAIAHRDVRLWKPSGRKEAAVVADGDQRPPRRGMVEWVVSQGWATIDTSHALERHGHPVTLTETGTAILAS